MKFKSILAAGLAFCSLSSQAQNDSTSTSNDSINKMQFTFLYPVSTLGAESKNITNDVSFNLLWGVNGGVNSFELGGIANINNGNIQGVQLGGIANVSSGGLSGAQFAGVSNVNQKSGVGAQFSGVANVTKGSFDGAQLAGVANILTDSLTGYQMAGVYNLAVGNSIGAQVGTINNNIGNLDGAQIGIVNLNTQKLDGAQIGFINTAKELDGFQMGFVNATKNVKGFSLGFVNVADSIDGSALGFFTFVKDGYHSISLEATELGAGMAIRSGMENLYNIYEFNYLPQGDDYHYDLRLGLGSYMPIGKSVGFNPELTAGQLIYNNQWSKTELNLLSSLDLNFTVRMGKVVEFSAGPSFNFYVSNQTNEGQLGTLDTPYTLTRDEVNGYLLQSWIGGNASLRFRF